MRNRIGAVVAGVVVLAAGMLLVTRGSGDGDGYGDFEVVRLDQPGATWGGAFSVVSTVRELADGSVVVADPLEQVVVRLDMDAGAADTIGRVGEGPDEYRQPDAVWPLPGDRTLLVDLGNGRLTELGPDLQFGPTRPYSMGDPMQGQIVLAIPQAVDGMGGLYFRGFGMMGARSDSSAIMRFDLETEALDSVAAYKLSDVVREVVGGGNNQNERISQVPLSPADAWGVSADGRLAIARAGDYHLDWIDRDGTVTSGPPVPYEPVGIGRAEREEWAHQRLETGGGMSISVSINNGSVNMQASRGGSSDDDDDLDARPFPDVKPAFYAGAFGIPVDRAGRAWVRRHREAGADPRYDVFDGSGARTMAVEFGEGRRVVGFGDNALYAVHMNEYGLQTLERYALP